MLLVVPVRRQTSGTTRREAAHRRHSAVLVRGRRYGRFSAPATTISPGKIMGTSGRTTSRPSR